MGIPRSSISNGDSMRFSEPDIVGAWVIDPDPHEDHRGRFMRAWCAREFAEHGITWPLVATVVSEQDRNWQLAQRQGCP
jgi:dTDP-4-dehydrorhamnose 3,5-epimerase-like enzyme